ncbi:MAG: regulatory protein TetR [Mycobacterium sp.]|nr:regulatory protein TetR [Mycobacterium sp.]
MTPQTRQKRTWQTRDTRREEIIAAAAHLWAARGYHAVGIAELCNVTGIGKGAFYHHVGSKEEILFEIHNRFVDPMLVYGRDILDADLPPYEALRSLGQRSILNIAVHREHCAVFIREMMALGPERLEQVRSKRREFRDIVAELLQRGVDSGEFKPVPVGIATQAFLALHNYVYTWMREDGEFTPEDIAEIFDRIFLEGIAAR